jgi:hypothetical protein
MAVGRNLSHVQVGAVGASPTYLDVPGILTWDPTISTDTEPVQADGTTYFTSYAAPAGEGDFTFIDFDENVVAVINGGTVSSSGVTPNVIDRYEQPGTYAAPPFITSDWVPNADQFHDTRAGMRTTAPNCTATPVSRSSGQDTTFEWTASTSFSPDENDVMLIYELLETGPVFTAGVMPVNVEAPGV